MFGFVVPFAVVGLVVSFAFVVLVDRLVFAWAVDWLGYDKFRARFQAVDPCCYACTCVEPQSEHRAL